MIKADKVIKDTQVLKKLYGDSLEVGVGDTYYACYFKNSIGTFKFLVSDDKLDKPFALSYAEEQALKAIKKLQEI